MALNSTHKKRIINKHKQHDSDTGSAVIQIGLLTARINKLVDHLKKNPKDNHSRRGLLSLVSKRKKLLKFLKTSQEDAYGKLIKALKLKG